MTQIQRAFHEEHDKEEEALLQHIGTWHPSPEWEDEVLPSWRVVSMTLGVTPGFGGSIGVTPHDHAADRARWGKPQALLTQRGILLTRTTLDGVPSGTIALLPSEMAQLATAWRAYLRQHPEPAEDPAPRAAQPRTPKVSSEKIARLPGEDEPPDDEPI